MDPASAKPVLDLLVSYGVPLVITGGVLWLGWRYIPKWIDASINAQTQVPIELAKLNATLTEGFQKFQGMTEDAHAIKEAVKHAASAGEQIVSALAKGQPPGTEAINDLRKMKDSVENGK